MPATTGTVEFYAAGLAEYLAGELPATTNGALKALLTTEANVVNKETHTSVEDLSNEVFGDDWPQGGVTLTGVTVTVDAPNDLVRFSFDAIEEDECTFTGAKRLIVYHALPVADADKTLFCAITFASTLSPVGGGVSIEGPNGLFTAGY